ncbi:MAG: ATP-binding protein [Proteobacteria bacterium]|nr:ATP-binding protein [Pseudomonadota bacterium]
MTKHPQPLSQPQDYAENKALDHLCRFSSTLGTTLDVDTLIEDALEPLRSIANADRVFIAISRTNARQLEPIGQIGGWQLLPQVTGLSAPPVASLGTETLVFAHMDQLPPAIGTKLSAVDGPVAAVPLWAHAHLRGLVLFNRRTQTFSAKTVKLLTASGRQLALAIENSQLLSDLQDSYQRLMDAQEELIRSERLAVLGQLSATMAHEIRNPLATIFSAISQIRKHSNPADIAVTLLDIAEEEAIRLNTMVAGLLDFARPRTPMLEAESLIEVVQNALAHPPFTEILAERNIECTLQAPQRMPPHPLDRELIFRALDILLSNALAAIEQSPGQIHVRIKRQKNSPVVEITDNGAGISPEHKAKIFEPFYSTRPSGIGLGLPTVQRIMEDHQGHIELTSQPGAGTVVRLFFGTKARTTPPSGESSHDKKTTKRRATPRT